jgi:hypothetical protein
METIHQNSSYGFPSDPVKAQLHSEQSQYYRKGKFLACAFKEKNQENSVWPKYWVPHQKTLLQLSSMAKKL